MPLESTNSITRARKDSFHSKYNNPPWKNKFSASFRRLRKNLVRNTVKERTAFFGRRKALTPMPAHNYETGFGKKWKNELVLTWFC